MNTLWKAAIVATLMVTVVIGAVAQQPNALANHQTVLVGTTGACNSDVQGGPCTEQSTLVQLDPATGALIQVIGPVGYTVNGLAWDRKLHKLFATTSLGDVRFHGLITIDLVTGKGKPVDSTVINFGLPLGGRFGESPVHSITIGDSDTIVGWYDEFPPDATSDTFVHINKRTGIATEFPNTGIDTSQNGLSFDEFNFLWNVDSPKAKGGVVTQTVYLVNPVFGTSVFSRTITPATPAAIGDFNPDDNLYYGLNFLSFVSPTTFLVAVDPVKGTAVTVGQTVDNLHAITFLRAAKHAYDNLF